MSIESFSDDIASYLDWALETGLWDGRPVSRLEAAEFHDEVIQRLVEHLLCEQKIAEFAWLGTAEENRSLLARDIQHLDFSKSDLILQTGLKKSVSKFWKKHKKEILIGAAIVAALTVVVVVAASTAAATAAAGGAALAAGEKEKPARHKKDPPTPIPAQPPTQLAFEETGVSFDGRFATYSDILQTRIDPTPLVPYHPEELQPIPPSHSWPIVEPPSFLDVQPHYSPPSNHFDFLKPSIQEIKKQTVEAIKCENSPIVNEKHWLSNFLEIITTTIADHPDLFNPDSFCITPIPRHFPETSSIFSTLGKSVSGLGMGGGNGMNTTMEEAVSHANYFAQFAQGHSFDWVHNNTHGPVIDMLEIVTLNLRGFSPNTAALHRQLWEGFHAKNLDRPHNKYLQFGHSQDSIHIFNALKKAPEEIQQRVIVILFGPAVVIPDNLCFRVRHYACEGDIVPCAEALDANVFGGLIASLPIALEHEEKIIWLPRHPDTKNPHDLQNPAFVPTIEDYIDDHISRNGIYYDWEKNDDLKKHRIVKK